MSSKRVICSVHDDIINLCNSMVKDINRCSKSDTKDELYDVLDDIRWKLDNYIISYAEEAKDYGQSMENRLTEYRNAVERLGFTRDK